MQGKLETAASVKLFALGGNATITFRSVKTGTHFTFKIRASEDKECFFVSLLTGSDNESDFSYIGYMRKDRDFAFTYAATIKDKETGLKKPNWIMESAAGVVAFSFVWKRIAAGVLAPGLEAFHEGRCGKCGRKLTHPSSIVTGFGPECAEQLGIFMCEAA